jgi:hypothetical protein
MTSRLTIVALLYGGSCHELSSLEEALRLNGRVQRVCVHRHSETLNRADERVLEQLVQHFGAERVVLMVRQPGKHIERGTHVVCREG